MFDYVQRREFEAEHDRRVKAEATVEALQQQLSMLLKLLNEFTERSLPKATPPAPGFGLPPGAPYSSTEILSIPAVGKRGIRERNAAARMADARNEAEAKENDALSRRASLSAEERKILDAQIPK
jgi:hypothetical protein